MQNPLLLKHVAIGSINLPVVDYWGEQWVPLASLAQELAVETQRLVRAVQSELNPKMIRLCTVLVPHLHGPHQLAISRGSLIAIQGRLRARKGTPLERFLADLHLMAALEDPEMIREIASRPHGNAAPKKSFLKQYTPIAPPESRDEWFALVHQASMALSEKKMGRPASISRVTVNAICRQHAAGTSIESLANMYRVAPDTIKRIVKGTYQTAASQAKDKGKGPVRNAPEKFEKAPRLFTDDMGKGVGAPSPNNRL